MHLVLDHDGYLPQFAVMTPGQTADIFVPRRQRFEPGTMLVFDRGYTDLDGWLDLSRRKVSFVTRLKDNIRYGVVQRRPVRPGSEILRDEVVLLERIQEAVLVALMRRIEIWVEDRQETMVLLTNHLRLAAPTVAAVYRERRQVEQFFRALEQSLRVKTSFDTSDNCGAS
jgi:transposase